MSATRCNEQSSGTISGFILDANGAAVPANTVTAARLTLFDVETYAPDESPTTGILNGRENVDVLAESPTRLVLTDGAFTYTLEPDDNVIMTPRRQVERHRAEFVFEFTGGQSVVAIEIEVVNQQSVS